MHDTYASAPLSLSARAEISAANGGEDKDSVVRQRTAIEAYVKRAGYEIIEWHDDPAVKGADDIDTRPGFAAMLEKIAGNGVRPIIVETANRFARDLMVQEVGRLQAAGIVLIAADSPDQFVEETPTAVLIRQILGAVAQFDKAMTVAKLKGARNRKRAPSPPPPPEFTGYQPTGLLLATVAHLGT
jgi:DNA invertase Pin-like site-specific DNA recombinase